MSHTAHEPTLSHGLADGCPRCEEHAADPMAALDPEHLNDLWQRMVAFEYRDMDEFRPRSAAEGQAMRKMREYAVFLRRTHLVYDLSVVRFYG